MEAWGLTSWWRARRARSSPPPRDARHWVHPSELPSFEGLTHPIIWPIQSRAARFVAVVMAVALVAGTAGLILTKDSSTASVALPAHVAKTLDALPSNSRVAAAHTVDLTISTPERVVVVSAMVLPHDLAVTTTPIPQDAYITGSIPSHLNFKVTWVGRDDVMGFSIVHLGVHIAPLDFAPLPASTSVVAISPILNDSTRKPQYAWAVTTLGDPTIDAKNGVISYLATQSDADLSKFTDAVAVNQSGRVVAVLSASHLWYSAQFVARIAYIVATGRGCHSSLGIIGATYQGGGVQISHVIPKSPAQGHFSAGDVITAMNGKDTDTFDALMTALYLTPAYTEAAVTYVHQTSVLHTVVTLGCAL